MRGLPCYAINEPNHKISPREKHAAIIASFVITKIYSGNGNLVQKNSSKEKVEWLFEKILCEYQIDDIISRESKINDVYPLQFKSWDLVENAIYENYPSIGQPTGVHIH